jgi:aminoglycoside 6'-N-acetyltransferase
VQAAKGDDDWGWQTELATPHAGRENLIADVAGRPVGFVQITDPALDDSHHWGELESGFRAVDIWIGAEDDLGKRYGTRMMEQALERCFADPAVNAVLIDPLAGNKHAIRFYQKFGFEFVERRQFGEADCSVYQLTRKQYQLHKLAL